MQTTGERLLNREAETGIEKMWMARHGFAYSYAANIAQAFRCRAILDVGCADGYGASIIARANPHARVVGMDHEQSATDEARRICTQPNLIFECADARQTVHFSGDFDLVTSFQMIEHVVDDVGLVREMHRLLASGGRLVLTTPNRTYRLRPGQRPWNRWHVREYSANSLRDLLAGSFAKVDIFGVRGCADAEAMERGRVSAMRKYPALNWLRRTVPESWRRLLAKSGAFAFDRKPTCEFSGDDFWATADDVDNSLDLLAVCRK